MEKVLLAVVEQVGLSFDSRMKNAIVVFLRSEPLLHQLVQSGIFIWDLLVQGPPLSVPSVWITVSSIPPFIPNDLLEFSIFKMVNLGCKDPKLRHVQSLKRQWFMFMDLSPQTPGGVLKSQTWCTYTVYASSGQMKYFEWGNKRLACPINIQRLRLLPLLLVRSWLLWHTPQLHSWWPRLWTWSGRMSMRWVPCLVPMPMMSMSPKRIMV